MKTFLQSTYLVGLMFLAGCGLDGPIPRKPQADEAAPVNQPSEAAQPESQPAAEKAPPEKVAAQEASPLEPAAPKTRTARSRPRRGSKDSGSEKAAPEQPPGTVREKAAVGMGEQGRGYGGGIITRSVHTLFTAKEKITLDQMQDQLNFYKAEHEGHPPKTQEEFMEKIINERHLRLPTLPPDERYVYDPTTGELMVEMPKR